MKVARRRRRCAWPSRAAAVPVFSMISSSKRRPQATTSCLKGAGQKVLIDPVSLPFLENATIDFTEELIGARFVIENPNASSSCGCGVSFAM